MEFLLRELITTPPQTASRAATVGPSWRAPSHHLACQEGDRWEGGAPGGQSRWWSAVRCADTCRGAPGPGAHRWEPPPNQPLTLDPLEAEAPLPPCSCKGSFHAIPAPPPPHRCHRRGWSGCRGQCARRPGPHPTSHQIMGKLLVTGLMVVRVFI